MAMKTKLVLRDGQNNIVPMTRGAIRKALGRTDFVEIDGYDKSISNFTGSEGDEIDVYDGWQTYDPQTVYEPDEIEEALDEFMDLIQKLLDRDNHSF